MRNEAATNKNHPAGVGNRSPKILVRCIGHEFYYPISDILRLFTGEIPRTEENCVVCDSGAMASVHSYDYVKNSNNTSQCSFVKESRWWVPTEDGNSGSLLDKLFYTSF